MRVCIVSEFKLFLESLAVAFRLNNPRLELYTVHFTYQNYLKELKGMIFQEKTNTILVEVSSSSFDLHLNIAKSLLDQNPFLNIFFISDERLNDLAKRSRDQGIKGFYNKHLSVRELLNGMVGGSSELERSHPSHLSTESFSFTELKILELLGDGHTTTYVLDKMGISSNKLGVYLSSITRKLGVHSYQEAIQKAFNKRIIKME